MTEDLLEPEQANEGISGIDRSRRESTESVGGFAAIAGVQKSSAETNDGSEDLFPMSATLPSNSHGDESQSSNADASSLDMPSAPGR